MNQKRKEIAFEVFYQKFKAAEILNYIKDVMESCVTKKHPMGVGFNALEALHKTSEWGVKVFNDLDIRIDKYLSGLYGAFSWKTLDIGMWCHDRISIMQDEIISFYEQIYNYYISLPPVVEEEEESQEEESKEEAAVEEVQEEVAVEEVQEQLIEE